MDVDSYFYGLPTVASSPLIIDTGAFSVSGGIGTITANTIPNTFDDTDYLQGQQYTSGLLSTFWSFSQTYGYVEVRAQLPPGPGMWPTFYLIPTYPVPGDPDSALWL